MASTSSSVQQLTLPDGRSLEYQIGGAEEGYPLIYLHETPGSVIQLSSFENLCTKKRIKLVTFSRAGYGNSTRRKGRSVVDEVQDVDFLLKHLDIKNFLVAGWSGGGPPALACAAHLQGCRAALIIAGVAPFGVTEFDWFQGQSDDTIQEFQAALKGEAHLSGYVEAQRAGMLQATPDQFLHGMIGMMPKPDGQALKRDKQFGLSFQAGFAEGLKENGNGWVDDDLSMVQNSWGFQLNEIKVPVHLWQGSVDNLVPLSHAEWLAQNLPQEMVRRHFMDGEGHISIFINHMEVMLGELLGHT